MLCQGTEIKEGEIMSKEKGGMAGNARENIEIMWITWQQESNGGGTPRRKQRGMRGAAA